MDGWVIEQQTGRLINLFDFCQPITDVFRAQLTNESARILQHKYGMEQHVHGHCSLLVFHSDLKLKTKC